MYDHYVVPTHAGDLYISTDGSVGKYENGKLKSIDWMWVHVNQGIKVPAIAHNGIAIMVPTMLMDVFYGPAPLEIVTSKDNCWYDVDYLCYRYHDISAPNAKMRVIDGIVFNNVPNHAYLYVSDRGVVFDIGTNTFIRHEYEENRAGGRDSRIPIDTDAYIFEPITGEKMHIAKMVYNAWIDPDEKSDVVTKTREMNDIRLENLYIPNEETDHLTAEELFPDAVCGGSAPVFADADLEVVIKQVIAGMNAGDIAHYHGYSLTNHFIEFLVKIINHENIPEKYMDCTFPRIDTLLRAQPKVHRPANILYAISLATPKLDTDFDMDRLCGKVDNFIDAYMTFIKDQKPVFDNVPSVSRNIEPFNVPRLMTVEDVMETLSIGRNTAYALLNDGSLKGVRVGKNMWRVTEESVREYINGKI